MKILQSSFCAAFLLASTSLSAAYLYVPQYTSSTVQVVDTATNTAVGTITVGADPFSTTTTPNGQYIYVNNFNTALVSIIDTSTNTVTASATIGTGSTGTAVNSNGLYAYCANFGSTNISVINTSSKTTVATITVGNGPVALAASPTQSKLFVANANSNNVSIINTNTNTVISTVAVGAFPFSIAILPNGNYAYVVNTDSSTVSVIDITNSIVSATISGFSGPKGVAITPNGSYAYVTNASSGKVSVIKTSNNTIISTVTVGSNARGIAIDPNGIYVYVANTNSNSCSIIDTSTNSVVATIPISSTPGNGSTLAISLPHQALVLDSTNNKLFMIDETAINRPTASLSMSSGSNPQNIVLTSDRMSAYAIQNSSNQISSISMQYGNIFQTTQNSSITVGVSPIAMVLSIDNAYLYVIDSNNNSVYRINRSNNSVTTLATLTGVPQSIGIDPTGNYLVVTVPTVNRVVIIADPSNTASTNTIDIGSDPNSIAFDTSGNVYVTCGNANTLTKLTLSSGAFSSLSLTGSNPGAINQIQVGGTLYFLIAMQNSTLLNLVNPATMGIISTPTTSAIVQQIITNPSIQSVAYLIEPGVNAIQSIDFTSSLVSPTISEQYATGNHPIGGGCREGSAQLFILNSAAGSVSAYTLSGTNQRVLTEMSGSPVTGLGTPQGISVAP